MAIYLITAVSLIVETLETHCANMETTWVNP